MIDDKYLKTSRKYLDLSEIYYNEYSNKLDSEVIFENNFKYEISLSAFGLYFSYFLNGFNQNTALFARKIIEDYYLYKLKDTTYLTHSNFKLFKIASYKGEVGTRALHEISDEFRLPINIIKKRMFDNDFWTYPMRLDSFEHLFDLNYEGKIKDKTNIMLKNLYKSYGIYLHYCNSLDISINEFNSSLSIINQIIREVIGKDYEKVKKNLGNESENEELMKGFVEHINNISLKSDDLTNIFEESKVALFDREICLIFRSLLANIKMFLNLYFNFYISKKRSIGLYLNKVFIEELSYYFALIEMDTSKNLDIIFAMSNYMTNKLINSNINKNVILDETLLGSKMFQFYYEIYNGSLNDIENFVKKYKDEPYKLINNKYDTFNSFVNHFINNFNKKEELRYIYNEANSIGHSYGLIQNHEFNYKKTFSMLLDVIENYLRYYSIVFLSRNFKGIDKRKERNLLESKVNEINDAFIDLFNFLRESLELTK